MKMTLENLAKYTRQNTGSALHDSGKFYGYHYQTDVPKDLIYNNADYHSISLTHWLQTLSHCEPEQVLLNEHWEKNKDIEDFLSAQEWIFLRKNNTYNYDNDLDQDFAYTIARHNGVVYFIIRIHCGADIRGGYSDPLIFRVVDEEYEQNEHLPLMQVSYRPFDTTTHNISMENAKDDFTCGCYSDPLKEVILFCETILNEPSITFDGDCIIAKDEIKTLVFQGYIDCPNFYQIYY